MKIRKNSAFTLFEAVIAALLTAVIALAAISGTLASRRAAEKSEFFSAAETAAMVTDAALGNILRTAPADEVSRFALAGGAITHNGVPIAAAADIEVRGFAIDYDALTNVFSGEYTLARGELERGFTFAFRSVHTP